MTRPGLVTETLAYDGGRPVTAYVPPDPPEAAALRAAGADAVMSERVASHGTALWQAEFPLMVAWAFGRGPAAEAAGTPLPAS